MVDLFRERKWNLIKYRNLWFGLSALIIGVGLYFLFTQGLNFGIDFTGGGLFTYELPPAVSLQEEIKVISEARTALQKAGIARSEVQLTGTAGRKDQILVRTLISKTDLHPQKTITEQGSKILPALEAKFPGVKESAREMVAAVVSKDLIKKALIAVFLGSFFVLLYVTVRYEFKFAVCGIVALVHDLLVLVGVFAIIQGEVNSPFVAAILTVVGYSVHDSVVIFDRIRENVKLRKRPTFAEIANLSLLETMARSVNTTLTLEFTLVALFFLGGTTLHAFVMAMIIGVSVGAYSSIFNASQLLVVWKQREEQRRPARASAPARAAPVAPPLASQTQEKAPASATPEPAAEPAPTSTVPETGTPQAPPSGSNKPSRAKRKGKVKKRRRRH